MQGLSSYRSRDSADEVNLKLVLLSTQDDALEIFFDLRTGEFYTVTAEVEDESDERDEALLNNASKLAYSVCVKYLP